MASKVSNFEISIDIDMDSQLPPQETPTLQPQNDATKNPVKTNQVNREIEEEGQSRPPPRRCEVMPGCSLDDWVEGRMVGNDGNIVQVSTFGRSYIRSALCRRVYYYLFDFRMWEL